MEKKYIKIIDHYEKCYLKHGDNNLGVDWPNLEDALTRYQIMSEGIEYLKAKSCLDFGCGLGHFYEFLKQTNYRLDEYAGLELSRKMIDTCREKHPNINFYHIDVLQEKWAMPGYDCAVMNGVFTEKLALSQADMFDYFKELVEIVFNNVKKGVVLNVMSSQVDWKRDDLFHLSLDDIAWFVKERLSRKFIIRNDYGLYDYTVYIKK